MKNNTTVAWDKMQFTTPKWFQDAKFGLFFHWGPYSVPAFENEWYSRNMYAKGQKQNRYHVETYGPLNKFGYKDFYPLFTGENFDADEWADLVVKSGAKYAGPVTEHSDNFSMWDSKVNPINCVNYGPKRDVTGECVKAFQKNGIKILATFHHQWLWGWFMSTDPKADVYIPENEIFYGKALPLETNQYAPYRLPDDEFNTIWRDKVLEVVQKYHPDVLYFDSRTNIIADPYKYDVVSNYYNANHLGVITYKQEDFPKGIGVLDLERGSLSDIQKAPWQIDDRLEDNVTWCIVKNPKYRSPLSVIQQLCDVVSKNGNLLLNVGPKADGSFPEEAKQTLYEIGNWLQICGEAIFETRPFVFASEGPTKTNNSNYDIDKLDEQLETGIDVSMDRDTYSWQDFRFTQKGNAVYAITFGWPEKAELVIRSFCINGVLKNIREVTLLGHEPSLLFTQQEDGLHIKLPHTKPCNYAYAFRILV